MTVLTEIETRDFLAVHELPMNRQILVQDESAAVSAANEIGFPVVLKLISKNIVHKSDVDGVKVNLGKDEEVRCGYQKLMEIGNKLQVPIEGVSVQKMVQGVAELFIGIKRDETFGAVVLVGFGGVGIELIRDFQIAFPPLSRNDVKWILERLKSVSLLRGYRGRKLADEAALVDVILLVSRLSQIENSIIELDLNPIIVRESGAGVVIVDARAQL